MPHYEAPWKQLFHQIKKLHFLRFALWPSEQRIYIAILMVKNGKGLLNKITWQNLRERKMDILTFANFNTNSNTFFISSFRFRNSKRKWNKPSWWIKSSIYMILHDNFDMMFFNERIRTSDKSWSKKKGNKYFITSQMLFLRLSNVLLRWSYWVLILCYWNSKICCAGSSFS